jgi:hypothetical protein
LRHFNKNDYRTALAFQGQYANLFLHNGQCLSGQVIKVYPDGILFNSSNPGLFFYPFAAIALLALSFGAGFGLGRATAYPYRYPFYGYPYAY